MVATSRSGALSQEIALHTVLAASLIAASFATYPSLGDRGITVPRAAGAHPRVEMTVDKGLIVEIVVRCSRGSAIISYSKVERLYCSPRHTCAKSLAAVVRQSCG